MHVQYLPISNMTYIIILWYNPPPMHPPYMQVKDASQYHFEPRKLVNGIISIYLNLGREESFCAALPRDGRSFSMDLFIQAERVIR